MPDDGVAVAFEADKISRKQFLEWFNWFGVEGAESVVYMKFLMGPEARIRFAKAILPEGYVVIESNPDALRIESSAEVG